MPQVRAAFATLFLAATAAVAATPATPPVAKGTTILLVDDAAVNYRSGTERVVRPATRRAQVIAPDKPWELMIAWTSVYRNPQTGKYQLWYQGYAGNKQGVPKSMECVVCYAESDDGITFTKPELDLFPFKDVSKTNIVLIGNGLPNTGDRYGNCVLVDPDEKDANKRYKMAYYDWSMKGGRPEPGLHVAFSPDGIRWTKHAEGPLNQTSYGRYPNPPFAGDDPFVETPGAAGKPPKRRWDHPLTMSDAADVVWDPTRKVWALYGKMWIDSPTGSGAWKHAMGRSESKDFVTWTKGQLLMTPDDLDPTDVDFHTTPVFIHKGVYFLLNQILDRKNKGIIDIELATSRDGQRFERNYRAERFLPSNEGNESFDGRAIFSNSTPVVLDDEVRIYYGAYNETPIGGGYEESKPKSGVGVATVPIDRFGGVRPVAKSDQSTLRKPLEHIGQVTLKAVDLTGVSEITVNADAKEGNVRVEILNDKGYRMRGFERDAATPITGDQLRGAAKWKGKSLTDLPPGSYQLRLHLDRATLYAVDFK